ncbi:MAG: hypothetical protein AABX44_01000 [Nanoarchaeota archaeon]
MVIEKYFGKLIKDYENLLSEQGVNGELKERLVQSLDNILILSIKKHILRYHKINLKTEFIEGVVPAKIAEGLEKLFFNDRKKENSNFLRLNKSMDYNKPLNYYIISKKVKNKKHFNRIKNILRVCDLNTYKDLQRKVYKRFNNQDEGRKDWKNEKEYARYLGYFRGMGKKSIEVIILHLKKMAFDFSEKSARKVYEKSNK